MSSKDEFDWAFYLQSQAGIVTHSQAREVGLTENEIAHRITSGRWQRVHRGIYATFTGKLPREARLWAAFLWAGKDALLSHQTAAELHELTSKQEREIHVTVPKDRRPQGKKMSGVIIHRSGIPARTVVGPGKLAKTTAADTILDLVATAGTIDDAYSWVSRAVANNKASAEELRQALERRPRFPGKAWLQDALAEAEDGVHFPLELRYARDVERAHGLPKAERQARRVINGTTHRKDNWYPGYNVCVELDGVTYHRDRRSDDRHRDNANLAADDARTFRFEIIDVTQHACRSAALVATTLQRAGWKGKPRPCRKPGCQVRSLDLSSGS